MYFDPMYFLFILPAFIFSLWASWRTRANFKTYSKVPVSSGMSGAEAAQRILDGAGISDVSIGRSRGLLSDHYNPVKKNLALSDGVFDSRSLAAVGIAAHEAGHAIYGQGCAPELDRTLLAGGASLAVHESQSRLYENILGRSYDFWTHFYGRLQELFPSQLSGIDLDSFYKGINKVEPSLIRVEADEATYNLHIMLRLELEIALIEGSIAAKDLPEAWNSRMDEYLGLTPPDDADGVLQDVHWSSGYFGYFSTYALGNLVSAQLWETVNADIPNLADQIRAGEFAELTGWMHDKIHRHGAKFEPQELIERITGSKIDSAAYMRYLKTKYTDVYGL